MRERLIRAARDGTPMMIGGTIVAGVFTYLWHAAGTRTFGEVGFAPVAAAWTVMFLVITVLLAPVEQYTIRTLSSGPGGRAEYGRGLRTVVVIVVAAALVITAVTYLLRGPLFEGEGEFAFVCGAITLGFGQLAVVRGLLAARREFAAYGYVLALDAGVRLVVGVPLLLGGASAAAYAWTIPLCALVGLWWLRGRTWRSSPSETRREPHVSPALFIATTAGGSAAGQAILAGGPLVLAVGGASPATVTTLFVTQTAFRALLMIAVPAWSRLLPSLTRVATERRYRRLSQLALMLGGAAVAGALGAAAISAVLAPPVIELFYGGGVRPSALLAAATAAATVLAVGNLGLTQILVAVVRTHRITLAWWTALAVSAGWLFVGTGNPLTTVATAFLLGEAVALAGLTLFASWRPEGRVAFREAMSSSSGRG